MTGKNILLISDYIRNPIAKPVHSSKLEWALRNFITSASGYYYDDEISNGIVSSYFRLDSNICVEQCVYIRQKDYLCLTTLSCSVDIRNTENFSILIKTINTINMKLDYGNFEADDTTGKIRYRTYYHPRTTIETEALDQLLGYPLYVIKTHGPVICSCL